jgi:hypothetical protein
MITGAVVGKIIFKIGIQIEPNQTEPTQAAGE